MTGKLHDFSVRLSIVLVACVISCGCTGASKSDKSTAKLERFGDSGLGAGRIDYRNTCVDAWEVSVELSRLQPGGEYVLALNAFQPNSRDGEILGTLKQAGWPPGSFYIDPKIGQPEGYWDFATITADANGAFSKTYALPLPVNRDGYFLKFLVKRLYGDGGVLLQAKSVGPIVVNPRVSYFWIIVIAAACVILLMTTFGAAVFLIRRRQKRTNDTIAYENVDDTENDNAGGDNKGSPDGGDINNVSNADAAADRAVEGTGDRAKMAVESWNDLAIGIEYSVSEGRPLYWALTPPPEFGGIFRKSKGVQLTLGGEQWKSLLDLVAQSDDGRSAAEKDVITQFGYANLSPRDEQAYEYKDLSLVKNAHNLLSNAVADLNKRLRRSCRDAGLVVRRDGRRHPPPLSVATVPGTVTTTFVVGYLLASDDDEGLRFKIGGGAT